MVKFLILLMVMVLQACGTPPPEPGPLPKPEPDPVVRKKDKTVASRIPADATYEVVRHEGELDCIVFRPAGEAEGVMMFLHGTTGDVYGGLRQGWVDWYLKKNFTVVLPRSTGMSRLISKGHYTFRPDHVRSPRADKKHHMTSSWQDVDLAPLIKTMGRWRKVTGKRLVLFGFSNGGALAGYAAWTRPDDVSDVVLLSSVRFPFTIDARIAPLKARKPGFLEIGFQFFHGRRDNSAAFKGMPANVKALRRLGVTRIVTSVDPRRGHDFWIDRAEDVFRNLRRR